MNETTDRFLEKFHTEKETLIALTGMALAGADDGELYVERTERESIAFDNGQIEAPDFSIEQGFGLRRVEGKRTGYVSSGILTVKELCEKGVDLRGTFPCKGMYVPAKKIIVPSLYIQRSPLTKDLTQRIELLREIDNYIRCKDSRVQNVYAGLTGQNKEVMIVRSDGLVVGEIRPLVRLVISVVMGNSVTQCFGGRYDYAELFDSAKWKFYADKALADAQLLLEAKPCPAGKMDVVFSNGWSGVLLHEAFGHMLEGDFICKGTSAFTGKKDTRIAAKGVNVIDQGNISHRRGSLSFDDEGTPTQRNILVEDGILKSYMHDRMSARELCVAPTGNGRRESYECAPMPRMTNTFMEAGPYNPKDIISATESGIYVIALGGGQVDITTGKFIFSIDLAWRIKNGLLVEPIKGAKIIGAGPEALLYVDMIGNDLELDGGTGTCGKEGQGVPVGIGQPTIRIKSGGLTVGGTEIE